MKRLLVVALSLFITVFVFPGYSLCETESKNVEGKGLPERVRRIEEKMEEFGKKHFHLDQVHGTIQLQQIMTAEFF